MARQLRMMFRWLIIMGVVAFSCHAPVLDFTPILTGNGALVSGVCADSTSESVAIAPSHTFDNPEIGYIYIDGVAQDTFLVDGELTQGAYEALYSALEPNGVDVDETCDETLQVGVQTSVSGQVGFDGDFLDPYVWVMVGDGENLWGLLVNQYDNQ